jgi:flagellar biosynthesis/type III secretory pathway protein FliH
MKLENKVECMKARGGNRVEGIRDKIQWHPGFYGAAELELLENKAELEFEREYNLSKEPLRVDLLIVKKRENVRVQNEIGHIFRKFNILEYKSPDDGMSIDDYFKAIGYACLYKGLGATVDEIPADELTVSLFRETYPREMIEKLKKLGAAVQETRPGIYSVTGIVFFDTQIVVTSQLEKAAHSSLRVLSKNAQEDDVRRFLLNTEQLCTPGDKHNADAVLQVSISANERLYDKLKEEIVMCEALQRLMKDEIEAQVARSVAEAETKAIEKGIAKGLAEGLAEGHEKGLAEGHEKGLAEGRKKGLAEGQAKGKIEGKVEGKAEQVIAKAIHYSAETVEQWLAARTDTEQPGN